jgi:signal transduction histidine kinase
MKNRTKLWLVMLISPIGSLLLFLLLSQLTGNVLFKGYNLNQLNRISQDTLKTIERQKAFDKEKIQPILDQVRIQNPALRFEWLTSDGKVIYDTSGEMKSYDFKQFADLFLNMPNNLWGENKTINLEYSVNDNGQSNYLLMSLPSEAMKPGLINIYVRTFKVLLTLSLPILLSFMVPYLLSIWFFSSMNRRISKLNHALGQVSIGSDVIILEDKSKDEIGQLTQHYNLMAQRIQSQAEQIKQLENKRKLLLSNLSHDLRTPLTMVLGHAETIRTGLYKNENELQASAKIILQRSRYMDKLLDQLLDITRQDADELELHLAPHNLSEIMRKIMADYLLLLDGQNFTVEVDIADEDVEAFIDASLIERVLRNLLDNAIRYGKEGNFLGIGLIENKNDVCISVKDRGKGIALKDRERIFERFYRVDRGRNGDGLGIGLSIVKEIVELHKGNIQVMSTPYDETVFLIRLPKKL